MNKIKIYLCVLIYSGVFFHSGLFAATGNQKINTAALQNRLELISDGPVKIHISRKTGTPSNISFSHKIGLSKGIEQAARTFFDKHKDIYGINNQSGELKLSRIKKDKLGMQHVRFKQNYKGISVFGAELITHIDKDSAIKSVNGVFIPDISVSELPSIGKNKAIKIARQDLGENKANIISEDVSLTIINPELFGGTSSSNHLSWKFSLESSDPFGIWIYFVDAHDGSIVFKYNDLKDAKNRNTYTVNNADSLSALPGTLLIAEGGSSSDPIAQTAHDNAGITYDYFLNTFGRDSYDNLGSDVVTSIHFGNNFNNAFWYGSQMTFGDGDGVNWGPFGNALDIVAHEFTHGVTENEANLIYLNQSGALNESYSDIFGAMVDRDDWLIGEDAKTPDIFGDAARSLEDPTLFGHPDNMGSYLCTTLDGGGVHTNSSIPNKVAYLISEGGTHYGVTVVGIGKVKMEQISYRALSQYLTPSSDFLDAKIQTLQATADLYGAAGQEYESVLNAFEAVGIREEETDTIVDGVRLDSSVTASSSWIGLPASNTIDDDLTTNWLGLGSWSVPDWWLQYDLGSRKKLENIVISWKTDQLQWQASDYSIQISSTGGVDSSEWTTIYQNQSAIDCNNDIVIKNHELNGNEARYVRIFINEVSSAGPAIYEVEIFGLPDNDAVASSSSTWAGTLPESTNDDDFFTYWWGATFENPWWVKYDLGANYDLSLLNIYWGTGASDFEIQVSDTGVDDDEQWRTVSSGLDTSNGSPYFPIPEYPDYQVTKTAHVLEGTVARYIRVKMNEAAAPPNAPRIYEVDIYGLPVVTVTPTSSSTWAGTTPEETVDGNYFSYWWGATFENPWWLKYDLGSIHQIDDLELFWGMGMGSSNYEIQISDTGGNNDAEWVSISSGNSTVNSTAFAPLPVFPTYQLGQMGHNMSRNTTRYIRVLMHEEIAPPNAPRVYEMAISGTPAQ